MRNPDWTREEMILALNIYLQSDSRKITTTNPAIVLLRETLRKLPFHPPGARASTFRNATGVAMTLTLFAIVERELRRAADYISQEDKVPISYAGRNGSVIPAVAALIKVRRKITLGEVYGFSDIMDLQKVRDCIVHCYGDVGLSRDRVRLMALSIPSRGLDSHPGSEMEIAATFLEHAVA